MLTKWTFHTTAACPEGQLNNCDKPQE